MAKHIRLHNRKFISIKQFTNRLKILFGATGDIFTETGLKRDLHGTQKTLRQMTGKYSRLYRKSPDRVRQYHQSGKERKGIPYGFGRL